MDDQTYDNECLMECNDTKLKKTGSCEIEKVCACPKILRPVCGMDDETYNNDCLMDCAKVKLNHVGPCDNCPEQEPKNGERCEDTTMRCSYGEMKCPGGQ